ncbi:MAG: DHH family phosphoesterase [Microgenomates group bacterium]
MERFSDFSQFQQVLSTAQTIFVLLPQKLNQDTVAAGLSLFLSLKKAGKQISVFCPKPITVEFSSLVGVDKIKNQLEGKNLVISFDYLEDSIEKVSYNIENNKFNLLIQPKEGYPPLSPQKVQYSYVGANADLFLVFGTSLEDLGEIYSNNKNVLEEGKVVTFDLADFQAASYCEVVANLLAQLKLPVDEDIASNLLAGIEEATASFSSPKTGPGSFEAAAFCLRAGGRRPEGKVHLKPMPEQISAKKPPHEVKEEKPSPDWLTPKIYKGNTLI